ncbi:MAG: pilus assembly protein [Actinomycetia bacterium]|nr:pilus assembly protein [Actinomycetes bacterium]MCP4225116.1 pilus assembly protein [Actinomycetes bacterium]MCP5032548.1 pilus assembly protein [Actinomycetes bacterium]
MRRSRGQEHGRERGAALVEAAVATPVFFLLILGIFEFGLLYRDSLTTNNATHQGARAASVSGQRSDADFLILRSVEHGIATMGIDNLDFVVVFRASGPDATVPTACLTSSQAMVVGNPAAPACNRYVPADFTLAVDDALGNDLGNFRCSSTAVDKYWCPSDRETSISAGIEYVGVHVQTTHAYITGVFGGTRTLTETRIQRLEPEST